MILAICCHVDLWGADLSFLTALKGLKNNGYRVVVLITRKGRIEEELKVLQIEYYVVPQNNSATNWPPKYKFFLLKQLYYILFFIKHEFICDIKLFKFLRTFKQKPDIIYTNTILPTTGVVLSLYYKIPHIMHIRELSDDDFHFTFYIGKKLYLKILDLTLTRAICISKAVQMKFEPYFKKKTCLIYNGVTVHNPHPSSKSNKDTTIKILFIGRLSKEKGVMYILEAINVVRMHFTNIKLDIYGEGVDKVNIDNYIKQKHLENIIVLKGYTPSHSIPRNDYDFAIMSSPYEAFGRVTIEYMLSGLPVIGRNGGATPEIIEDGITGLLYSSHSELVNNIQLLIENKDLRKQMGEKGRQRAESCFYEEKYVCNVNYFFDYILRNNAK